MSRLHAVRQQLHISIDPYRSGYGAHIKTPPSSVSTPSPPSSTRASIGTSRTSDGSETPSTASSINGAEWIMFSVLCLHDFQSDDPDHLPFHKNEILDIVKQEATGWWAAMRPSGNQVGWIPSAFVAELTGAELDKLQRVRFNLRVYEYDAERLYNSAPISKVQFMYPGHAQSPLFETRGDEWVPVSDGLKVGLTYYYVCALINQRLYYQ